MSDKSSGWPSEPYKGLAYYSASDRLLFSGRDDDVDACIYRLTSPETRVLLLHGQTGCGKSSFLRAGLIPNLEEASCGYLFLRDEADSPIFIRCGADPVARIAEQLFHFASRPLDVHDVLGERKQDLAGALQGRDLAAFVAACRLPGALCASLRALSSMIPRTFVIVLDQAEEVITLNEDCYHNRDSYRRREDFFGFVNEFSTINFPVKLVIALRKDYSGQFIELAQVGGSIDLRATRAQAPEPTYGAATNALPAVRSDIKLYLLQELRPEKVLKAIQLPTSKIADPESGAIAPFEKYKFSYAPGVAEIIVRDLFQASSTAALPVMQIVCRELYNEVRKQPGENVIDAALYAKGGGIQGPVDRHISRSLRMSFRNAVPHGALAAAEDVWREVLGRFIRRETDGSVHTKIVEMHELRELAAEMRAPGDVQTVVNYLSQPEVLLLRIAPAAGVEGGVGLSLGHDFIAMVLNRWKVSRDEQKAAEERLARIRKNTLLGAAAAAVALAIGIVSALISARNEAARQNYDGLLMTSDFSKRTSVPTSILASAYALKFADDMHRISFWKERDDRADRALAELLAGLPQRTFGDPATAPSEKPDKPEPSRITLPLTLSGGFLRVAADDVEVNTPGSEKTTFKLAPFTEQDKSGRPQTIIEASEIDSRTLLLLRAVSDSPYPQTASSVYQLYVLSLDGRMTGPLDLNYLLKKIGRSPGNPDPRGGDSDQPFESTQLSLTAGRLVARTYIDDGKGGRRFLLQALAFDATNPADPLQPGLTLPEMVFQPQAYMAGGLLNPVLVGDYLVVPRTTTGDSAAQRLVKYDLRERDAQPSDLITAASGKICSGDCNWQYIPTGDTVGPIVFAAMADRRSDSGSRNFVNESRSTLSNARALRIIEPATGRETIVDAESIVAARAQCRNEPPSQEPQPGTLLPEDSKDTAFIVAAKDAMLLGFAGNSSFELIRIDDGKATCADKRGFFGKIDRWALKRDGTSLLGADATSGALWTFDESVAARAENLLKEDKLLDHACAAGLKDMIPAVNGKPDEWIAASHLPAPPAKYCDGPSSPSAAMATADVH